MSMAESLFHFDQQPVLVVMGVSGCGKSTVAEALGKRMGLPYIDGDDYHPTANVEKMAKGIALNDNDRWPWLDTLSKAIYEHNQTHGGVIATCSSLKKIYRKRITESAGIPLYFVFLHGERATLLTRMQSRENHYMPPSLLDSQLDTLEIPDADELVWQISIESDVASIVDEVLSLLEQQTNFGAS